MRHLDLFSGIGGFALAAEMVWPEVEHIFCDNDPFSQAILKKHWPNAPIYGDIKELTAERIAADTNRAGLQGGTKDRDAKGEGEDTEQYTQRQTPFIDLLTGGFPCQPFSSAGQRRGTEDDRHLWPEMLRVIRETNPHFVLGENVGGFLTWNGGLVFEAVCADLEEAGYEVCPLVIPAAAVGAPHRRDRVWIAAHAKDADDRGDTGKLPQENEQQKKERQEEWSTKSRGTDTSDTTDAERTGWTRGGDKDAGRPRQSDRHGFYKGGSWKTDWPSVAARLCTLDDGLRYEVVRPDGGRDAEVRPRPKGWRNAALRGAGNAIVPQVAAEIMRVMKNS